MRQTTGPLNEIFSAASTHAPSSDVLRLHDLRSQSLAWRKFEPRQRTVKGRSDTKTIAPVESRQKRGTTAVGNAGTKTDLRPLPRSTAKTIRISTCVAPHGQSSAWEASLSPKHIYRTTGPHGIKSDQAPQSSAPTYIVGRRCGCLPSQQAMEQLENFEGQEQGGPAYGIMQAGDAHCNRRSRPLEGATRQLREKTLSMVPLSPTTLIIASPPPAMIPTLVILFWAYKTNE